MKIDTDKNNNLWGIAIVCYGRVYFWQKKSGVKWTPDKMAVTPTISGWHLNTPGCLQNGLLNLAMWI